MCRFLIYAGREVFMSDLLTRSEQSLIQQSFRAQEWEEPLNGDGFGVGWYVPEIDPIPCVYSSVQPAWSNRNLDRLADKVRSGHFFAHVRAATPGMFVSELNCHPFQHDRFLWMHNGTVAGFNRIKRRLRESLDDDTYDLIQGTTDSEHAFSVFLNQLETIGGAHTTEEISDGVLRTISQLEAWTGAAGVAEPSRYNFAVTDGETVVATRFISSSNVVPHTLYYTLGDRFEIVGGAYRMRPVKGTPRAIIIASEPITKARADWTEVPPNHMVVVTPDMDIRVTPIQ